MVKSVQDLPTCLLELIFRFASQHLCELRQLALVCNLWKNSARKRSLWRSVPGILTPPKNDTLCWLQSAAAFSTASKIPFGAPLYFLKDILSGAKSLVLSESDFSDKAALNLASILACRLMLPSAHALIQKLTWKPDKKNWEYRDTNRGFRLVRRTANSEPCYLHPLTFLRQLDLDSCFSLSDLGLRPVLILLGPEPPHHPHENYIPGLRSLNLSRCRRLSNSFIECLPASLTRLNLSKCPRINSEGIKLLIRLPLRHLSLCNLWSVDDSALFAFATPIWKQTSRCHENMNRLFDNLEVLSLRNCTSLTDAGIAFLCGLSEQQQQQQQQTRALPGLRFLDLHGCNKITSGALDSLARLLATCNHQNKSSREGAVYGRALHLTVSACPLIQSWHVAAARTQLGMLSQELIIEA